VTAQRLVLLALVVAAGCAWGALLDPTRWWLGLVGLFAACVVVAWPNKGGK